MKNQYFGDDTDPLAPSGVRVAMPANLHTFPILVHSASSPAGMDSRKVRKVRF
jgi:hypothetical protein